MNESFQVAVIIEKLPNGWKDFKNYLKHKRKEMSRGIFEKLKMFAEVNGGECVECGVAVCVIIHIRVMRAYMYI